MVSILFATGATIFLEANSLIKATLFLIFMVINLVAISDLSKIKHFKAVMAADMKKRGRIRGDVLGGIIGVVWLLQMPGSLSPLESAIWIFTNTICLMSTLYVVYRIANAVHS